MANNKKTYKPLEKTQLNRIAEEQEMKQCKRSGDNIASLLRRRALLPNPGLGMKGSRGQFSVKNTKSSATCPKSAFLVCQIDSENHKCISPSKEELKGAPLRAQSVQNISKIPSSAAQCSTRTAGSKKKHSEEKIKRAFSAQNVASVNMASKSSKQILSSKAVAYNAELLMKFDAEKKALDSKICELTELSEVRRIESENLRKELEEERESQMRDQHGDGELRSQLEKMVAENEALKKQLKENGISIEHFTDTEKLFLISNIDPYFADVSVLESSDDLRVSTDDISAIAQRYISSTVDDMTNLDRHNSMSVDRGLNAVSIADLTDRFLQMQEAQHSVDEELQATLQELSDLQENVNELNEANESLKNDNEILLGSLCGTTEKLENARIQVENLKSLLIRDIERCDNNDRELQLTGLLKCDQQEKDELLLKQMEYLKVISSLESENRELRDALAALKESFHLQEEKNKNLKDENTSLKLQFEHPHDINSRDFNIDTTSSSSFVRLDNLLKQKEVELERIKQISIETVRELKQQNEFLKEKIILQSQHNKELDRELKSISASLRQSKAELSGCKKNLSEEREEWAQFQSDLLTAVVVANNLNMEKDNELKRLKSQQKEVQEKYQNLIEHISSKGFLDGQVALDYMNGNEKGDHESEHGVEAFLQIGFQPVVGKDVVNRNGADALTPSSKETNRPLQTNQSLATSVKTLADALPFIGFVHSGVTSDDASMIPGILMKNHNSERRDEKDKSSLSATPSYLSQMLRSDPLMGLVKSGGSKRNALLTWCQNKLKDFEDIEVTNFSSSWNDGLALCALLNTYLPHHIPYSNLKSLNVKQRFQIAFDVAKEAGLELGSEDDLNDLVASDRPAWQMVFGLVANIYKHFEVDTKQLQDPRRNSLHQR